MTSSAVQTVTQVKAGFGIITTAAEVTVPSVSSSPEYLLTPADHAHKIPFEIQRIYLSLYFILI
jgi:hypothetical protein